MPMSARISLFYIHCDRIHLPSVSQAKEVRVSWPKVPARGQCPQVQKSVEIPKDILAKDAGPGESRDSWSGTQAALAQGFVLL